MSSTFYPYKQIVQNLEFKRKKLERLRIDGKKKSKLQSQLKDPFYSWECVSIVTKTRTIDFRFMRDQDKDSIYIFINALQYMLKRWKPRKFVPRPISVYRIMSIKMKIAYETFIQGKSISELFLCAIEKTIIDIYGENKFLDEQL